MAGKYFLNQLAPRRRQPDDYHPAISFLTFSTDPGALFEVVDYDCYVAAAAQELLRQITLLQWTDMKQSFHHGELAVRQAFRFNLAVKSRNDGIRCAKEVDERVERSFDLGAALVMSWHAICARSFEFK
jgi:hypothetical protein